MTRRAQGHRMRLPSRLSNGNGKKGGRRPVGLSPSGDGSSPATWLDRVIGWIAPELGARRIAARLRARALSNFYDGATVGRRGASIRRSAADSTTVTRASLSRLREGSRDLVRNNPYARRAIDVLEWNVVGTGITTRFVRGGEPAQDIQDMARDHLGTTACDADGRYTYAGLQSLAVRCMYESGEVLVRRRRRRMSDVRGGLPLPVQFQVIEPDYLDTLRDGTTASGGRIVQGVEFDAIGRRRGYWLYPDHPGSLRYRAQASQFVPESEVIHLFVSERPGQVRGIPRLAPVLLRLADFADYEDAQLVRQKIAACFAGFVKESFEGSSLPSGVEEQADGTLIDTFEPGMIERLPPGTDISFAKPPELTNYDQYAHVSLRAIAVGAGLSYEALSGDLSNTSFSSGRMGHLEFQRNVARTQHLVVIPQLLQRLESWFLEAAMLMGADTGGVTARHIPPKREMIDPSKEGKAERDEIRSGQKTLSEAILARGRDPREHLEEYRSDMDLLDELDLTVTSDVRKAPPAGAAVGSS